MLRGIPEAAETVLGETPLGLGIAAAAVVAILGARAGKPLVKRAIVGYLALTERARELAAEAGEQVQDLYTEAKYEYEAERAAAQGAESSADAVR
jgi:hypothetical protein